jgi:O-methyltransferase involved in polyketide biosynthesis
MEVDFEGILEYKHSRLDSETPRCRLERLPADLANPEAHAQLFEFVGRNPALMIRKGLLRYLPKAIFTAIAEEASKVSGIRRWLLDVTSLDAFWRMTGGAGNDAMERLRPADHLQGQALLDAARESDWEIIAARPYGPEFAAMSQARLINQGPRSTQAGREY